MTDEEYEALHDMLTSLAYAITASYDGERETANDHLYRFWTVRDQFFRDALARLYGDGS